MRRSMFTLGLLSMVMATGLAATSNVFASDASRVDVIETIQDSATQTDSMKISGELTRVDLISQIGSGGPAYSYSAPLSH